MKKTREELRQELQQKLDRLIEEALDWYEENESPTMGEIEQEILRIRKDFSEEMAQLLVDGQSVIYPDGIQLCPKCVQPMRNKGQKRKTIDSMVGQVELHRTHYYCPACKGGRFPLDQQLELWNTHYSPELSKQLVWLSGVIPSFEKAEETLARIGRLSVSDSSIWRQIEKWGPQLQAVEEADAEKGQNTLTRVERIQKRQPTSEGKGVAMDGAAIFIREDGWSELKVGTVFDIEVTPTKNKETGGWDEKAHAINTQYIADLDGPKEIGKKTWAMARHHGWFNGIKKEVLGDGAVWIWKQAEHRFVGSKHLVDWYHGTERLGTAAKLLYPNDTLQRDSWYETQKSALFSGQAQQVAEDIIMLATEKPWAAVDAILSEALYFDNNHERMQYQSMQEKGYLIGSGVVESGCKQYKARFCGPGMRWSRDGAKRLMPVRSSVMGNSFDSAWSTAYHLPPN